MPDKDIVTEHIRKRGERDKVRVSPLTDGPKWSEPGYLSRENPLRPKKTARKETKQ